MGFWLIPHWFYYKSIWVIAINILYFVTLKYIGHLVVWMDFTHTWLCNIMHQSPGKYWFSGSCRSSKCLIHFIIQYINKNISLNISTNFIRKVYKYWEAVKLTVADTCFPKTQNFAGKHRFYHWQQIFSVVLLEVTGSLVPFSENVCQIPKSE